ncbi:MAG: PIG-L family deacetylase [Anaerolineae bacterium]|nr:PIG-L family deacetylase [Anaerolineae bacterium]
MFHEPLRILAFGAHPDDCDILLGGMAILWSRLGHQVTFVSTTNGDTGHYRMGGGPLARRRQAEAQRSAEIAGIRYRVLDIHNGQIMPTLENRWRLVEIIREVEPDLVVSHRPCDYHPDHRYTGQLVQDAAYTVTIPNVVALTPHLKSNPVFACFSDRFQRPYPFQADVIIDIDAVMSTKIDMLHCHTSQFYEWLPYNQGKLDQVPEGDQARKAWINELWGARSRDLADTHRNALVARYGPERGKAVRNAEALEISEYGAQPTSEELATLFPF